MKLNRDEAGGYHFVLKADNLRPCPFCGGDDQELANTHTPSYWIECPCGLQLSGAYGPSLVGGKYGSRKQHEASALSAIAKWNSRVSP